MSSGLVIIPNFMPALDTNGNPISGALIYFYLNGTNIPTVTYQDAGLTTQHTNPVVANLAGVFPLIFSDSTAVFTVTTSGPNGENARTYENIYPSAGQETSLDAAFGPSLPVGGATSSNVLSLMSSNSYVRVDDTFNLPDTESGLNNYVNSTMVGTGTVRGIPYKAVIPDNAQSASDIVLTNNCRPDQLPKAQTGSTVAFIFVGDSLTTPAHNNNFVFSTGWAGLFERHINKTKGAKTVEFYNRAIGGATFGNVLSTRPDNYPTWWTDPTKEWFYYINTLADTLKAAGKRVVIVWGFGMNVDTSLIWTLSNLATYLTCLSYAEQIFATNVVPSLNAANNTVDTINNRIGQMSLQYNWAVRNNYGVIDFGRQCMASVYGQDIRSNHPYENFANTNPNGFTVAPIGTMVLSDGACTPMRPVDGNSAVPVKCVNFNWLVDMVDASWDSTGNNGLYMNIGANQNDILSIRKSTLGTVDIYLYHGDSVLGLTLTASVTGLSPGDSGTAGTKQIMIEVVDNMVTVRFIEKDANGAVGLFTEPVFQENSLRNASRFTPTMTTVGVGRPLSRARFDLGEYVACKPTISNRLAWGRSDSDTPEEGTGDNHNTSLFAAIVYNHVIQQCEIFNAAPVQIVGAWTPDLTFTTGGPPTFTGLKGTYVKTGRQVLKTVNFNLTGLGGGSGWLKIGNWKYPRSSSSNEVSGSATAEFKVYQAQTTTSGGVNYMQIIAQNNAEALLTGQNYLIVWSYETDE